MMIESLFFSLSFTFTHYILHVFLVVNLMMSLYYYYTSSLPLSLIPFFPIHPIPSHPSINQ